MNQRANGEGSIYRRSDGRWTAACYVVRPDGTRVRRAVYGKTRKEVADQLAVLIAKPRRACLSPWSRGLSNVHVYPDHVFIVVHAPQIGAGGHVHYLELDQFVGKNFLVTVHGPLNPKVPLEAALRETEAVAARMDSGRLRPTSPFGLTYAIVSAIARREAEMVAEIAREVGLLEQRVMAEADEDPQEFLSQLFAARHELLTIKTMAEQGSEIYRRASS
jgi:hypothetical protein